MPIIRNIWSRMYVAIATLSWTVLAACFFGHAVLSWFFLSLADEGDLTDDTVTFAYYYMTTATTVGYGDLSPSGQAGRLVDAIYVLPGSIALFTAFLGKAVSDISGFWRRRLQGLGDFTERTGHTIVVGWQGSRSRRLIDGLLHDRAQGEHIVLLATGVAENPMPDIVDFVLAEALSDLAAYARAGAAGAATVVIRGADDDDTLAATLAARAAAPSAHVVASFEAESTAALVRKQMPTVEVMTSIAADRLVRAARDPGSSRLAELMFSGHTEDTAYSLRVPDSAGAMGYFDVLCHLKRHHDLTLIGVSRNAEGAVDLNCSMDCEVGPGDALFYIADQRCDPAGIDWQAIQHKVAA
ncbi:MAG: ion transporter [Novosphingobium sp.]|nr:ion transporter [Novosphingobium sp.]